MLGLVGKSWARLCASWRTTTRRHSTEENTASEDVSDRIRARYDTARKRPDQPTKEWLREHGVRDDWSDAWRTVDRW
jgi:hypothetical protein